MLEELEQAGRLGITLYQIDDGWQNGTSANSVNPGGVWNGYYAANADFWEVNPLRFPNGLEPVAAFAKSKGVHLGLWFSPDSSHEFANWKKDSETLIGLHRRYGIAAFKMDGVKLTSKVSEENLAKLIQQVLTETGGNVFFNMDVTAIMAESITVPCLWRIVSPEISGNGPIIILTGRCGICGCCRSTCRPAACRWSS